MFHTRSSVLRTCLFLPSLIAAHPLDFEPSGSSEVSTPNHVEPQGGLFNWAWGAESTVSVVDRNPALTFESRPATFGTELTDPLLGYVIPLSSFTRPCAEVESAMSLDRPSSNTGCPKLCVVGPSEPESSENWLALVQRGECHFVDKVREAQRLGAKAVVVGGDDPEISGNPDILVNMFSPGDASDVHIASTYIRYSDYVTLSALIAASNTSHSGLKTLSLLITSDYSAWEWYSPIMTFIIILLLPTSLTFVTLLLHRVRASRAAQRDRAPENVVHHLPWRVFTGNGWEKHAGYEDPHTTPTVSSSTEEETSSLPQPLGVALPNQPWFETQVECAICLSDFVKGDKVRVLPCHHIFHLDEVDEWLIKRKKLCPICKADVTQPRRTLSNAEEGVSSPRLITTDDINSRSATERTPLLAPQTS